MSPLFFLLSFLAIIMYHFLSKEFFFFFQYCDHIAYKLPALLVHHKGYFIFQHFFAFARALGQTLTTNLFTR